MYHVERNSGNSLGWYKIPFIDSKTRGYCDGYVDAFDSLYPSDPHRIIKTRSDGFEEIVRETNGRGEVRVS